MSGPKRSQVDAQLKAAKKAMMHCANLIAIAKDSATISVLTDADTNLLSMKSAKDDLDRVMSEFTPEMCRTLGNGVSDIQNNANANIILIQSAITAVKKARGSILSVKSSQTEADNIFKKANIAYDRANVALDNAIIENNYAHLNNLRKEMDLAEEATNLFDKAIKTSNKTVELRNNTKIEADEALNLAMKAKIGLKSVFDKIEASKKEATARIRAEENAKKIAEAKLREANVEFSNAHACIMGVEDLPYQKFAPDSMDTLTNSLRLVKDILNSGDSDNATKEAKLLSLNAHNIQKHIIAAQEDFNLRKNNAELSVKKLIASLESVDVTLISEWSGINDIIEQTKNILTAIQNDINNELFDAVPKIGDDAIKALETAYSKAAENKSNHEKRLEIGEAVMDVLEEMGFDVASNDGSLDVPLKIEGHTPNDSGRGDFFIDIPLDGSVEFEVKTPEGDTTCIATVKSLQSGLAKRGVTWNTTDWGRAEDKLVSSKPSQQPKKKNAKSVIQEQSSVRHT